jgi:predicted ATPase
MLKQILLKNFKSYQDQALPLAPLTLMIGANASGKSNAIEAFRFLSWLAGGQKLSVIQHQVDDSEQIFRGNSHSLGYLGMDTFSLGCDADHPVWQRFEVTLINREESERDGGLHIAQEQILSTHEGYPLYHVIQPSTGLGNDIHVAYNNFKRGKNKPHITCTDQIAIMCQLESPATFAHEHQRSSTEIPEVIGYFQKLLTNAIFLDPVPVLMRQDGYPEKRLRSNCSNLSGVLFVLWNDSRPVQQKNNQRALLAFIQSLPEQDVKNLQFFEDRRGRVSMELIESFGGKDKAWSVELLSDGTLRVLAIAAAVLSAPEGSTVVIEEVDNGVHPSRARHLLSTMQEQAKRRNIRLLLTTHNPALMDALPDEALGDVVFCYRDPQEGDSRLVRLGDLPDYVDLVVRGSLGDLVTNGIVDRFVKCPTTPEAQKQKALDWLAHLQGEAA